MCVYGEWEDTPGGGRLPDSFLLENGNRLRLQERVCVYRSENRGAERVKLKIVFSITHSLSLSISISVCVKSW